MASKKYKRKDIKISEVGEPPIPYAVINSDTANTIPTPNTPEPLNQIMEKYKFHYDKLKKEADEKYGKKELVTVDEYFDKLWHIVEGFYEHV